MSEIFSRGGHANIFFNSEHERVQFPQSDLVKISNVREYRAFYALQFYGLKVAHLMFPDNVINPQGFQTLPDTEWYQRWLFSLLGRPQHIGSLFSKQIPTPIAHADFSKHSYITEFGEKHYCPCSDCSKHLEFHNSHNLHNRANDLFLDMLEAGLVMPAADTSDYCMNGNNIVFFEVNGLNPNRVSTYLEGLEQPNPREQRAMRLLVRFNQILESENRGLQLSTNGDGDTIRLS